MSNENNKTICLEIGESTFWAIVVATIGLTIVGTVGVASYFYNARLTAAFSAGYEEGTLPGTQGTNWVKHKP